MKPTAKRIVIQTVVYVNIGLLLLIASGMLRFPELYRNGLIALVAFAAVLHFFTTLSSGVAKGYASVQQAKTAANVLRFMGLLLALLVFLYFFRVDGAILLLGGSVGGIVLGFAAQKTVENVFAGLLILISRNIEIGDRIRLVSATLPQTALTSPSYKFYSYDYLIQGYSGIVEGIGIFFTKVRLDSGLIITIPNSIFLSSGVVNITKTKAGGEKMLMKVRYEFPFNLDLETTLQTVKQRLAKTTELRDILVSEKNQEKDTIIIAVEAFYEDRREDEVKSQILMELIRLEKELTKN